jgi:FkbM family methyltransferase
MRKEVCTSVSRGIARLLACVGAPLAAKYHLWWTKQCVRFPNWCSPLRIPVLAQTKAGTIRCDARDFLQRSLLRYGEWEPTITRTVSTLLKEGDVFLDVGANVGYFSLLASRIVGETGLVYAVEPVPSTCRELLENLHRNNAGNVVCLSLAASETNGLVRLFLSSKGDLGKTSARSVGGRSVTAACCALDSIVDERRRGRIALVKIDVEGAELSVLHGMRGILTQRAQPYVICEVTDRFLRELGASARELIRFMQSLGFAAFRTPAMGAELWTELPDGDDVERKQFDALFVPTQRMNRLPPEIRVLLCRAP